MGGGDRRRSLGGVFDELGVGCGGVAMYGCEPNKFNCSKYEVPPRNGASPEPIPGK